MALGESHITSSHLVPLLRRFSTRWSGDHLVCEESGVIDENSKLVPDLLFRPPGYAPVMVECKYELGHTQLEDQAIGRLGLSTNGEEIETVIMVLYPDKWKDMSNHEVKSELESGEACLKWALFDNQDRLPSKGWASVSVGGLADLIEICGVSAQKVAHATNRLQETIKAAGALISNYETHAKKIAEELRQSHDTANDRNQTSRMAAMLITNAFMFQDVLSNSESEISTVDTVRNNSGISPNQLQVKSVAAEWSKILNKNWWPIFHIAKTLIAKLPPKTAPRILEQCADGAKQMLDANLGSVQDMVGQMFGRLVTDRDLLKAHYTRVEAATLLAELAVARMNITDWGEMKERLEDSDPYDFLVADFACGTGTLLTAAYRRLMSRARRAGVNDFDLHKPMIENGIVGLDVLPASAHLTAMMLSSAYPSTVYEHTNIHLVPFGCDPKNPANAYMGSLELLEKAYTQSLFGDSSEERVSSTRNTRRNSAPTVGVGTNSCQLVIMNPPYAKLTKNDGTGGIFAAFGASHKEQETLRKRLEEITKGVKPRASNGNVGLATNFFDLANSKVARGGGGVVAMVLPLTAANGKDWGKLRKILNDWYDNIIFVGLSGNTDREHQFSADTSISELLLIANRREKKRSEEDSAKVCWVTLFDRPRTETESVVVAEQIIAATSSNSNFVDIFVGKDSKGLMFRESIEDGGILSISSKLVCRAAAGLINGDMCFPTISKTKLPIAHLKELGEEGKYHLDIATHRYGAGAESDRAPFFIDERHKSGKDAYPLAWAHSAKANKPGVESRIEIDYEQVGTVREGLEEAAEELYKNWAMKFHLNQDFGFSSQRLAICITPQKVIGGRAWPSYKLENPDWAEFLALWGNTTLGLIAFWFTGTRQQLGRSILTLSRQQLLPVYDPRQLTADQKLKVPEIYNKFKSLDLLPANQADKDEVRIDLDKNVLCDLLELHKLAGTSENKFMKSLDTLRTQWCFEPHIAKKQPKKRKTS